jgi:hypothetical protein
MNLACPPSSGRFSHATAATSISLLVITQTTFRKLVVVWVGYFGKAGSEIWASVSGLGMLTTRRIPGPVGIEVRPGCSGAVEMDSVLGRIGPHSGRTGRRRC